MSSTTTTTTHTNTGGTQLQALYCAMEKDDIESQRIFEMLLHKCTDESGELK